MGCVGPRQKFADEEETLSHEAEALGFSRRHINEVDCIMRKYSNDETVNANQLKAITKALSLHLDNYETHGSINKFVAKLKLPGKEVYSAQKLLITGLLLSHGENTRKADALFEVVDREESGSIDSAKLGVLLDLWIDVVLDLGELGASHAQGLRLINYIGSCRDAKERWTTKLKAAFRTATIAKADFAREVLQLETGAFLNPSTFRQYLATDAQANPKVAVGIEAPVRKNLFANLKQKMGPPATPPPT